MDFSYLLLRKTVESNMTFEQVRSLMKKMTKEGTRFKLGHIDVDYLSVFYNNERSYFGRRFMPDPVPSMQITAERTRNPNDKVALKFKTADYMLVFLAIVLVGLCSFLLYELPAPVALTLMTFSLTFIYSAQVIGFTRQLLYFKEDLDNLRLEFQEPKMTQ